MELMQKQFDYPKVSLALLKNVTSRQKEMLARRFGLQGKPPETLQKIGNDFEITRERVRQIERESLNRLARFSQEKAPKEIFNYFNQYLNQYGGLKREDILLGGLAQAKHQNYVYFLLTLAPDFYRFPEDENVYSFWSLKKDVSAKVLGLLGKLKAELESKEKSLPKEELLDIAEGEPEDFLLSSIEIAKEIEPGLLGGFGLVFWPDIKPRGVRDIAFLVLQKVKEPLHFRDIAKTANCFDGLKRTRPVLPQTIHNELIRDPRFILVGRGIYALKEWGYNEGMVRDVIADIFKKNQNPLTKEEVIEAVLGQRLVKPNTILLNLHNKKYFARDEEGRYSLKG